MRPKLKDYVFYTETVDGALIRTFSGQVVLQGQGIYQWLERLAPHLNGERELDDLQSGLDQSRRDMVGLVIDKLVSVGAVRDAAADDESPLPPTTRQRLRGALAYAERF